MALYQSAYAALQVCVRPEVPFYHPITGVETSRVRRLVADFGLYGSEFDAKDPLTGEIGPHATISGFYYDSEVAAEKEMWTDDERATVEIVLDKMCQDQPFLIAKVDTSQPPAVLPWPTYAQTAVAQIPKLAVSLGLVVETLVFERENENRPKIVEELEDWLANNEKKPDDAVAGMITLDA